VTPNTRAAIGFGLIALAGPAGFLMYRLIFAGRLPPPNPHPQVTVQRPADLPQGTATGAPSSPARSVPAQLPDIVLPDLDGRRRSLAEWRGRPLAINFWATWCEPCRREIPLLETLRRPGAGGLEVIGIAVDFRPAVLKFARDMHMDYPVLIGEQDGMKALDAFGMEPVLPFTVFADGKGRIVTLKLGELHPDELRLIIPRLQDVDAGRLELAAAREQITAGLKDLAIERARQSATTAGKTPGKS
jgi:thiol-disulfide isomerase/thioredoxin